jgi:hypothetical protein
MGAEDTTMFRAAEVIRDSGTEFLCRIATKEVWVPLTEIRYGSELYRIGCRGRLIVSRWFAEDVGLRRRGTVLRAPAPRTAGGMTAPRTSRSRGGVHRQRNVPVRAVIEVR